MKTLVNILLLIMIGLIKTYSQDISLKSISLDNSDLKVLYFGIYNELKIEPNSKDYFIKSNEARIAERDKDTIRYFIVQPLKNPDDKNEIVINILKLNKTDTIVIDSVRYNVRFLQCRYRVRLNDLKGDYDMAEVKNLMKQEYIETYLPCSHYNKDFQIFNFEMLIVTKKGYQKFEAQGNKITKEMREAFAKLKINDKIIIWAYGEPYPYDSITQRLDPVIINVWEW